MTVRKSICPTLSTSQSLPCHPSILLRFLDPGDLLWLPNYRSEAQAIRRYSKLRKGISHCFLIDYLFGDHSVRTFRARARAMPTSVESADTRVIRVLQTAAQRVTQAQSQLVFSPPENDYHNLVKQKYVLDQTVDAYDKALSGHGRNDGNMLAVAAQNVVVQAAHRVYVDRGGGMPPIQGEAAIQSVTVGELTEVTQDAIAKAVERNGTSSTEVDIVVTAAGIIKSESDAASAAVTHAVLQPAPHQMLSMSTGTLPNRMNPPLINGFPPNLSPLPEYS